MRKFLFLPVFAPLVFPLICQCQVANSAGTLAVPGSPTAHSLNTDIVYEALEAGKDFGDRVNAANKALGADGGTIVVTEVPVSWVTTIDLSNSVSFECVNPKGILSYTGSGTAVSMSGSHDIIRDCYFDWGRSAKVGIDMDGGYGTLENVKERNGATTTKLNYIHSYGNQIRGFSIPVPGSGGGTPGTMFYCTGAIDTAFSDLDTYGTRNNTTSQTLVLDSGCDGVSISNWNGGFSGLHGLLVEDRANPGHPPTWLFAKQFVADDCTGGDCALFDGSLGGITYLGMNFVDSWFSGAGMGDSSDMPVTATANGVHISGGLGITITGSTLIRANAADGILIDNPQVKYVKVTDSTISGSNISNAALGSGIRVTNPVVTPSAPAVKAMGSGPTTYTYCIAWRDVQNGHDSICSPTTSVTNAGMLNRSNYNTIVPGACPPGKWSYSVWRTAGATRGQIAVAACGTRAVDNGLVGNGRLAPAGNSLGTTGLFLQANSIGNLLGDVGGHPVYGISITDSNATGIVGPNYYTGNARAACQKTAIHVTVDMDPCS